MDIKTVKEGLRQCIQPEMNVKCFRCPYEPQCEEGEFTIIKSDALEVIENLEKALAEKQQYLENLQKVNEDLEERIAIMQEGGWIPVSERKPNSCGVYIVARWFIDGCRREILTDACYFDGSNTWHDDTRVNHSRPYLTDKIVAWMSLPEPPKEGVQE